MKKAFTFILALTLAASSLVGCGSEAPAASAASPEEGNKTEEKKVEGENVNLEIFQQKPEVGDIFKEIIANFQTNNPNITIEQNVVPDSQTILQSRVASGDVPDIFSAWFEPNTRLLIDEGYVRDLTNEPFMQKVKKEYLDFTTYKDKNWMIPVALNFVAVFYNQDIFESNGIEVPTTQEEFYAVCDKLKEAGVQPLTFSDKEQWAIGHSSTLPMLNFFDCDKLMDVIHSDLSVKDIEGFSDFADYLARSRQDYAQPDFLGTGYDSALGDFSSGKSAMFIQGNWILSTMKASNPDVKFGAFSFPAADAASSQQEWAIDYTLCLSAEPRSEAVGEASLKFLDYFVNEGSSLYTEKDGSISCFEGVGGGVEEYQLITDMIDSGKARAGWFINDWPSGCYDEFCVSLQNYLTNFDKDAFYADVDSTLKKYKDK